MAYNNRWTTRNSDVDRVTALKAVTQQDHEALKKDTQEQIVNINTKLNQMTGFVGHCRDDIDWLLQRYNSDGDSVIARLNELHAVTSYLYEKDQHNTDGKRRLRVTICAGNQKVRIKR